MQSMNVQLATSDDLPALADIWYENKVLNQQSDSGLKLLPDAKNCWSEDAHGWLENPRCRIWVATRESAVIGYIIGWLQDMPSGFEPSTVGCITEMALDLHTSSGGAGRDLLDAAREWFATQHIENVITHVPHRQAVQQAFWRGQGARDWVDLMWLKL
ncbi:MAG: GNAT family N-acetyltransferase [Chloroflexi bacterium]|nr:GNAT family N-acetyltransferase [Chloroflexota bacterium]MCC6895626.1 GNAT family N-acetyltransferase [Anaerolineae bacterium]